MARNRGHARQRGSTAPERGANLVPGRVRSCQRKSAPGPRRAYWRRAAPVDVLRNCGDAGRHNLVLRLQAAEERIAELEARLAELEAKLAAPKTAR